MSSGSSSHNEHTIHTPILIYTHTVLRPVGASAALHDGPATTRAPTCRLYWALSRCFLVTAQVTRLWVVMKSQPSVSHMTCLTELPCFRDYTSFVSPCFSVRKHHSKGYRNWGLVFKSNCCTTSSFNLTCPFCSCDHPQSDSCKTPPCQMPHW